MKYYVLIINSGVDAETRGPFATSAERDRDGRKVVRLEDFNHDYDSIFRMDVGADEPEIYSFTHDELYAR